MPFEISPGCFPAKISDNHINPITHTETSPEMRVWGKIKEFFGHTQQPEALECIRTIYHPPLGATQEEIFSRFEQIRRLAHSGYEENIQSGRHGSNHFCILDASNHEVLSVTFDNAGSYTLECEGDRKTYAIATTPPQTTEDYDAIWSAWERAALPEEISDRAAVVEKMRRCLHDNRTKLSLGYLDLTTLPDYFPPNIIELKISRAEFTSLPALPPGLQELKITDTRLTSLPLLPSGLESLEINDIELTSLPTLPLELRRLKINHTLLTSLPVLPSGLQSLKVGETPLTSLPTLPSGLRNLQVFDILLTSLPVLPSGLQRLEINDILLTSLPTLPSELQTLEMNNTRLVSFPALPPGLKNLKVEDTPLTSLPTLPSELQILEINNTRLVGFPALPSGLKSLRVDETPLTSLPALPSGLQNLEVNNTSLTSLPALPSRLRRLAVNNTPLTDLPENIASLPAHADVYFRNNPLTERIQQTLRNLMMDPNYSGPQIHFSMSSFSPVQQEDRPLHLAVADWLAPENEGQRAQSDRWQNFGQQDNATSFSRLLDRLSETKNAKTDPGFKTQISSWLTDLACDDELRAKTFAMATEATSSCEDRVTLALNNMKNVQLVHRAEKGEFDNNHPGLVSVGREMFRLEKLEQIAREKASTLSFIDEIEVYLAYQNKLKEQLALTSVTKEMRFFEVSSVTQSDLKSAEIQVKTAENSEFMTWILQWAPLHSMLQRTNTEFFKALSEKKISDYSDAYEKLSDTELKPSGLLDNDDAVRTIGAEAMTYAENKFRERLSNWVFRMLAGHLNTRWP